MHIELRNDGWFEAGKDKEGIIHLIYQSKERIKEIITKIGEKSTQSDLEKALEGFPNDLFEFKGKPYFAGGKLMIDTPGLPGTCYLGELIR